MASVVARKNRFCVVYSYRDATGERQQKRETYKTLTEAKKRNLEIEYNKQIGMLTLPSNATVAELLAE